MRMMLVVQEFWKRIVSTNNDSCVLIGGEQKTKQPLQEYSKNSCNDGVGDADRTTRRHKYSSRYGDEGENCGIKMSIDRFFTFIKKRYW
jgi:hypothetical protein